MGCSPGPMRATFLGTSAGMPTSERGLPALALACGSEIILFDCGEGTQMQLRKAGLRPSRISRICVSHLHGDHVLGIPGLLMSLQLAGRTAPLYLHGPPGIEEFVRSALRMLQAYIAFPLEITEHAGVGAIARGGRYSLECRPLEHRLFCLGYALWEDAAPGALDVQEARRLGVPDGPAMGRLKAGEAVTLPRGGVVRPDQVLGPPRPGRRFAYCTDTRPSLAAVDLAADASLLVHEATFASDRAQEAQARGHSTASEAAAVALRAGARRLSLTHISPRYADVSPLLAEARAIFPWTIVASDMLALDIETGE